MSPLVQTRVMIVLWCAAGMIASYVMGYEMMYRDLVKARAESGLHLRTISDLEARVEELRLRSADRERLEHEVHSCYASVGDYVKAFEDVKWQMSVVVKTCPGRERPPKLPRP